MEACYFQEYLRLLFVFIVEKKMDYWFLKKNYQTIYPFCEICKAKGYEWPSRGKVKIGEKRKR